MTAQTSRYAMSITVHLTYADAVQRTRESLAAEGFGVLSEIDIAATMKKKLNVEFRPYLILGACNPPLAHRALTAERDIGLLLPCNVIVYTADDPAQCVVAAMDPVEALQLTRNADVRIVAEEARASLRRVLDSVQRAASAA
jgi:uncharacterized protein (DUF302 family)